MSYNQGYKTKEYVGESSENKSKSTPIAMVAPELKQNSDVDTEITKTCAVSGCEDSKVLDAESFFRFPEDPNLRQIWTDLTGRNNWTPTDYSYVCIQHFSVDCFTCDDDDTMVLVDKAVPSLKLPGHVFEVEYIDEETLDNEDDDYMETDEYDEEEYEEEEMESAKSVNGNVHIPENTTDIKNAATNVINAAKTTNNAATNTNKAATKTKHAATNTHNGATNTNNAATNTNDPVKNTNDVATNTNNTPINNNNAATNIYNPTINVNNAITNDVKPEDDIKVKQEIDIELLKLFTEVQKMQRQAVGLKDKLKSNMRIRNRRNRFLKKMEELIEQKKKILNQKRKKKARILLSLREKLNEDNNGLVLALPVRQTDDLKNFALSIYKYSPQAYIYARNTLRTLLPSTEVLDSWMRAGNQPSNPLLNSNFIKVTAEQTDTELSCKVSIG